MDISKTLAFSFFLHSVALSVGVLSVTNVPLKERIFMVKIQQSEDTRVIVEQGDQAQQETEEKRKKLNPTRITHSRVNIHPDSRRDPSPIRNARQDEATVERSSATLPGQEMIPASEREEGLSSLTIGGQTGTSNVQNTGGMTISLHDRDGNSPAPRSSDGGNENHIRRIQELIERTKVYPPLARKRRQEGTAVVQFSIDTKGLPLDISVFRSSGFTLLDSAARDIITRAAPFPHVKGAIEIPITFKLRDDN